MIGDVIHLWIISWNTNGFNVYLRRPVSEGRYSIMCKGRMIENEEPIDAALRIAKRQISEHIQISDFILLPGKTDGEYVFMLKNKFEHYDTGKIKGDIINIEISELYNKVLSNSYEYNIDLYELKLVKAYINSTEESDDSLPYEIAVLNEII